MIQTPTVGDPRTDTLEEDPTWDSYGYWGDNFVGTIQYTYSETYDYHWLPDSAGDDPVATTFRITGSTILQFEPTSGVFGSGGTATATMTLGQGGNTASVTATATPPNLFDPGPNPANQDLWVDVPVSGEAGQFTLNLVGLMEMPRNGSIKGRFRAERIAPLQTAYVWMSTPGNGAVVPVYPTPFDVTGGHNTGENRFRLFTDRVVKVYINHAYNPMFPLLNAHLKGEHRDLPNQGRWAVRNIYLTDPTPPIHIIATLQGVRLPINEEEDIGMDVDQVTAAGAPGPGPHMTIPGRWVLICLALLPAGGVVADRQQATPEFVLPPKLRGRRPPPMEELRRLKGPQLSVQAGKTNLERVVYGSVKLRQWVEPVLQPGFRDYPAWARIENRPAGELLTAVAAAIHGVLEPAYGAAVITDCPGLESWVALGRDNILLDPRSNPRPLVWAPGQFEILDQGGRIRFAQLRSDQQDIIRSRVWRQYATQKAIGPEALLLRDAYLEMDKQELEFNGRQMIATCVPVLGARWPTSYSRWKREGATVGPLSPGTYSRPPADLPASLTGKSPPCPLMKRVNLAEEEGLQAVLPPLSRGETTIDACLLHLVKQAKINCVAATRLADRTVKLPPGPISTARLMEAVAADLDAWWGRLGETNVLMIDPRLEREGAIVSFVRPYVLEEGLREVITAIGARGRSLLERTNVLRPSQMSKQQRFMLERLARTALVTEQRLDPRRAMELEGVRLVFLAGEDPKGSAGLEMLDREGRRLLVMQVPMDLSTWDDILDRSRKERIRPGLAPTSF